MIRTAPRTSLQVRPFAFLLLSCLVFEGTALAQPSPTPSPHGFHETSPPVDRLIEDRLVPPGTIVVEVLDGSTTPLPGVEVELREKIETVAEGKSSSSHKKLTGPDGRVTFADLSTALSVSFEPIVHYAGGTYGLESFRASEKTGLIAKLHVYPSTQDIKEAFVGMRGFVYISLRESVFHFDVLYRVINMSRVTWLPEGVGISLPERAEAISVVPGPAGFRALERGAELTGTFPPGQHDVRVQFQIPRTNEGSEIFTLGVLPHVVELRVLSDATAGLTMSVPNFEPIQKATGPSGSPVLITRRLQQPGQSEMGTVTIELDGLPVIGPERWYAALGALGLALGGFGIALRRRLGQSAGLRAPEATPTPSGAHLPLLLDEERKQALEARQVLLDELQLLERARDQELIGPHTYESTKRQIIDALARLALSLGPLENPNP